MSTVEQKNVGLFKILVLIFMVLTAIALVLFMFVPLISAIAYDIGTILLLLGMYILSKEKIQQLTWLKVTALFVLAMILGLVAAIFATMYPWQTPATGSVLNQLSTMEKGVGEHVLAFAVTTVFTGLFTGLAAFFIGEWYEDTVDNSKPFKTFRYFGVLFFAGQLIVFVGYELLQLTISQALTTYQSVLSTSMAPITVSDLFIIVGSILILVSFAIEIFAGFQVIKRVTNSSSA